MQRRHTSPIRTARLKRGLSQTQLGTSVGVTKSAISAWENDREFPEVRRLSGLRRALRPHLDLARYADHVEAIDRAKAVTKGRVA